MKKAQMDADFSPNRYGSLYVFILYWWKSLWLL